MALIRDARTAEALALSNLASRSKAHWPYDQDYLSLCRQATHVTEENIRAWHFRVFELNGKVLGFAAVAAVKDDYMLDHLWIEPVAIGKGVGKLLFQDAIGRARCMGWTKFLIASDPYAQDFYLKMGAKRIGDRESKLKPGFFLPLLEFDAGITLIGDEKVKSIPVLESGEDFIDLAQTFPHLSFDWTRNRVQKKSIKISLGRRSIGERLTQAQDLLPNGLRLLIKECHRPKWVQQECWDGCHSELITAIDVAPHQTGGAVDLTLADDGGHPVDMGTEFNAEPLATQNATYTAATQIPAEARKHRQILMSVMSKSGFVNYPTEWWHWSYGDQYWALHAGAQNAIFGSIDESQKR